MYEISKIQYEPNNPVYVVIMDVAFFLWLRPLTLDNIRDHSYHRTEKNYLLSKKLRNFATPILADLPLLVNIKDFLIII